MLLANCGETEFANNSGNIGRAGENPSGQSQDQLEQTPTDGGGKQLGQQSDVREGSISSSKDVHDLALEAYLDFVVEDSNRTLCFRDSPQDLTYDSGYIHSASSHSRSDAKHVVLSPAMTFELANFSGNVLPITDYSQDDVVMIVPSETSEDTLIKWEGSTKIIEVPEFAVFIRDADNSSFANGKVDDKSHMIYRFSNGESVSLPGNRSVHLSSVYGLAPLQTPHNDVRLSRLEKDSYLIDGNRRISFRIALIPHGAGFVKYNLQVPGC